MTSVAEVFGSWAVPVEQRAAQLKEGIVQGLWDTDALKQGLTGCLARVLVSTEDSSVSFEAFRDAAAVCAAFVGATPPDPKLTTGDLIDLFVDHLACFPLRTVAAAVVTFEELMPLFRREFRESGNLVAIEAAKFVSLVKEFENILLGTSFASLISRVYTVVGNSLPPNFAGVANRGAPRPDAYPAHGPAMLPAAPLQKRAEWDSLIAWDLSAARAPLPPTTLESSTKGGGEEGAIETSEHDAYLAYFALKTKLQDLPATLSSREGAAPEAILQGLSADLTLVLEAQHQRGPAGSGPIPPTATSSANSSAIVSTSLWHSPFDHDDTVRFASTVPYGAPFRLARKHFALGSSCLAPLLGNTFRDADRTPAKSAATQQPASQSIRTPAAHSAVTTTRKAGAQKSSASSEVIDVEMQPGTAGAVHDDECGEEETARHHGRKSTPEGEDTLLRKRPRDRRFSGAEVETASLERRVKAVKRREEVAVTSTHSHVPWEVMPLHLGPGLLDVTSASGFYDKVRAEDFRFMVLMNFSLAFQSLDMPLRKGVPCLRQSHSESTRRALDAITALHEDLLRGFPRIPSSSPAHDSSSQQHQLSSTSSTKTPNTATAALLRDLAVSASASAAAYRRPFAPSSLLANCPVIREFQFPAPSASVRGSSLSHEAISAPSSLAAVSRPLEISHAATLSSCHSGGSASSSLPSPIESLFAELLSKEALAVKSKISDSPGQPVNLPLTTDQLAPMPSEATTDWSWMGVPRLRRITQTERVSHLKRRHHQFKRSFVEYLKRWNESSSSASRRPADVPPPEVGPPDFRRERKEWGCQRPVPAAYDELWTSEKLKCKLNDYAEKIVTDEDPASGIEESEKAITNRVFLFRLNRLVAAHRARLYCKCKYGATATASQLAADDRKFRSAL